MVDRASNTAFLSVVEPAPLQNVGWTLRALSPRDYSTVVAVVDRFEGFGFNVDGNDVGGGQVTLTADDPVLTRPLGGGEAGRLVDVEALWQVLEDGAVRFEWLGEDVEEDQVTQDGGRVTVFAGRGTGTVLDWAVVLPDGATLARTFTGHPVAVWRILFLEAQAAGFLPMVSLGFTDAADSAGVPWGPDQELTVNAGDKLGDLLRRWSESNDLVWFMLPGFRLQVFQAYGSHREGSVVFPVWRSQSSHRRRINRRDLANVVYASSGDGVAVAEDSTSIATWRKRAGWVTAGDAGDASARSAVANTNLALLKDPRVGRTVQIIPGERRRPFEDFGLHDWVRVEVLDDDTASGVVRVVALAVKVDAGGVVTHEATFQTRFEARAVRLQRLLDRLGAGTASGVGGAGSSDVSTAVTVSKALAAVKLADLLDVDLTGAAADAVLRLEGSTWVGVLPGLSLLSDVDVSTVPAEVDVVLGLNRSSGMWEPVVASASSGATGGGDPFALSLPLVTEWAANVPDGVVGRLGIVAGLGAGWSSPAVAGVGLLSNVGPLLIASQSSDVDGTRVASKALDHSLDSLSGCSHTADVVGSWWMVDFTAARRLLPTRVAIVGRASSGYHPRNFTVQGSNDGVAWVDLLTVTGAGPSDGTWWSGAVTTATAFRYLRIFQTGSNSNGTNHLVIGEVEVWGELVAAP